MKKLGILALIVSTMVVFAVIPAVAQDKPTVGGQPGNLFPAFTLNDPVAGKDASLADFLKPEKETVLLFMNSACSLCNKEVKLFQQNWDAIKGKVELVLINVDVNPSRIPKYKEALNIPYPILFDDGATVMGKAGFNSTPVVIVLTSDGNVSQSFSGFNTAALNGYINSKK